jgi:hypothetical protein
MKITKDLVRKTIQEVAPLVEEESKLTTNLEQYRVILKTPEEIASARNISISLAETFTGSYKIDFQNPHIFDRRFIFSKNFNCITKTFKVLVSHEVMHNAQLEAFPPFINLRYNLKEALKNNPSNQILKRENMSLDCLIEGDATLIANSLSKRYFPICGKYFDKLKSIFDKEEDSVYNKGERILRDKFKGNRKDINELYTAPIEELVKIFSC